MYHSIQFVPEGIALFKNNTTVYEHSIDAFQGKNTWKHWHLIPSTRPLFTPPKPKYNFLNIPGANGTLDLSTALSDSYPVYEDRTGSNEFYVMNGYRSWDDLYSEIMNYCQGHKFQMVLEDDPYYFYLGRMSVNSWKSEKDWSKIVLDYQVEPFKYEITSSAEKWRWDPFSFEDDIVLNSEIWQNFEILNEYSTSKKYHVGDIVKRNGVAKWCKVNMVNGEEYTDSHWFSTINRSWEAGTTYGLGEYVTYNSKRYMCSYPNTDTSWNSKHWIEVPTTQVEVLKGVAVTSYPALPEFKITCNSTIDSNAWIEIYFYWYSSSGLSSILSEPKKLTATNNSVMTATFYEIVLRDYTKRYHSVLEKPRMYLGFRCPTSKSFTVSVTFKRGKL